MQALPKSRDDRKLVTMIFIFLALTFGGLAYLAARMQPADESSRQAPIVHSIAAEQEAYADAVEPQMDAAVGEEVPSHAVDSSGSQTNEGEVLPASVEDEGTPESP